MTNRSLKSGCLATSVVAGFFILIAVIVVRDSIQRDRAIRELQSQQLRLDTIADVKNGRGHVAIWDAELFEMLLNEPECTETVTSICFDMMDLRDPQYERVREFPNLKKIYFYSCDNLAPVLARSDELTKVESVGFETTSLPEAIVERLAGFPNLRKVQFEQVMPDETIAELRNRLPNVEIVATDLAPDPFKN